MKNLFFILFVSVAVLFSSCSKDSELISKIPNDAAVVVSVNPAKLFEAFSERDNVKELMTQIDNPVFVEIANNPDQQGIDLKRNIYVFATEQSDAPCVIMPLSDEKEFTTLLATLQEQKLVGEQRKSDVFSWCEIYDYGFLAYTDNIAVMLYAPYMSEEGSVEMLRAILTQSEDKSFAKSDNYQKFSEQEGDGVAVYISCAILEGNSDFERLFDLPAPHSAGDINIVGKIKFSKESIHLAVDWYANNKELQEYLETPTIDMRPLSGKLFRYVSDDSPLCIAMPAPILKLAIQNSMLGMFSSSLGIDLDTAIDAIDGDVLFSVDSEQGNKYKYMLLAECNEDKLKELLPSPQYLPSINPIGSLCFSRKDNILSVANAPIEDLSDNNDTKRSDKETLFYLSLTPKDLYKLYQGFNKYGRTPQGLDMIINNLGIEKIEMKLRNQHPVLTIDLDI